MNPTALVPVRLAPTAKRRLAHVLSPDQRIALVRRTFEHVVDVLQRAGCSVVALTPEPLDVPQGVEVWTDEGPGLNRAVALAAQRLGPPLLVAHADLPWLETTDVERLIDAEGDVIIARAHDGGTTGLLLRRLIDPAYGPGSALRHSRSARSAGLTALVVDIPGFARDV
ncbi:MAG: 2-phospho-L-lactate guanylyltransferase, partial [Actinomycetota bacterium]